MAYQLTAGLLVLALGAGTTPVRAADGGVARVSLLSTGPRASVVVELEEPMAGATAIEATDNRIVAVEIGPVRGKVVNQLLQAAADSPLVSQVRVRGITQGTDGTIVTVHIVAKSPITGSVRRTARRIYIDLAPRGIGNAAGNNAPRRAAAPVAPATPPLPRSQSAADTQRAAQTPSKPAAPPALAAAAPAAVPPPAATAPVTAPAAAVAAAASPQPAATMTAAKTAAPPLTAVKQPPATVATAVPPRPVADATAKTIAMTPPPSAVPVPAATPAVSPTAAAATPVAPAARVASASAPEATPSPAATAGNTGARPSGPPLIDLEAKAGRMVQTADVKGLEKLKSDLQFRRAAAAGSTGDMAELDSLLTRVDQFILVAQQNRLAADAQLFKGGDAKASAPAVPRTAAPAPGAPVSAAPSAGSGPAGMMPLSEPPSVAVSAAAPAASTPDSASPEFTRDLRALRPQLEQLARSARAWRNAPPDSRQLASVSAVLPPLRALRPPSRMAAAHANLCTSLELLELWGGTAVSPSPAELALIDRARVSIEEFLSLDRRDGVSAQ